MFELKVADNTYPAVAKTWDICHGIFFRSTIIHHTLVTVPPFFKVSYADSHDKIFFLYKTRASRLAGIGNLSSLWFSHSSRTILILKVSAFYLEKQKSFIPKKKFKLLSISKQKSFVYRPNFQGSFWELVFFFSWVKIPFNLSKKTCWFFCQNWVGKQSFFVLILTTS